MAAKQVSDADSGSEKNKGVPGAVAAARAARKAKIPAGHRTRIVSQKIRAYPNNKQSTRLFRIANFCRVAWNFCLAYHKLTLQMRRPCFRLRPWFNRVKFHRFPWAKDLPQIPVKNSVKTLEKTLARFYTARKKGDLKIGYPRFKNRRTKPSIQIANGRASVDIRENRLHLHGKYGKNMVLRLAEPLRFEGEICSAVLTEESPREWYLAVTQEILEKIPELDEEAKGQTGGGDPGIGDILLGYSDAHTDILFENPRYFRKAEQRISQIDREIARSLKQNNNRETARNKHRRAERRRLCRETANRRKDYHHKISAAISEMPIETFVAESQNANAWARSPKLGKSTHDAAPEQLIGMIAYKMFRVGKGFERADSRFASTKTCSRCLWFWSGMTLADREFRCLACGREIHREINASRNFRRWGEEQTHRYGVPSGIADAEGAEVLRADPECLYSVLSRAAPQGKAGISLAQA